MLDRERYRYQEFISDIAQAIKAVRDWLAVSKAGMTHPPGQAAIIKRYTRFMAELPASAR